MIENIPQELRALPQWVVHIKKKPLIPGTVNQKGEFAGAVAGEPSTWRPFDQALAALNGGGYDGLGFEFHNNGIVGVDLDHVVEPDGSLKQWAVDVVGLLNSYTEYSPSGTGLHIYVKGSIPVDGKKHVVNKETGEAIEMYQAKRYFTVTGNAYLQRPIEERPGIALLFEKYFPEKKAAPPPPVSSYNAPASLKTGLDKDQTFRALWEGHRSTADESANDIALMNKLAFWCSRDVDLMVSAFRSSPYAAQKDDQHREKMERADYLPRTAWKAAQDCRDTAAERDAMYQVEHLRKPTPLSAATAGRLEDLHPEKNPRYGWNDIGNGYLFADWYKDMARYVPERKKWFVYNGEAWVPDTGNLLVMEMCKELADMLAVYTLSIQDERQRLAYHDFVKRWQRRNYRETILKDAASVYPVEMAEFDKDPLLFNCKNGTLNLQTREFRPHSAADMLATVSGVKYDPEARCELWEKTIADIMQGDMGATAFLQKAMGYGLTGETTEECFFILYGATTRNGKGTTMETYIKLMGGYGRTARPEMIAQKDKANSNSPTEDIARLAGARVVNISEPGKQMVLSTALVKTLTGRDTINARFLNENSFEFVPQFKLFINTNHLPRVTDPTVFDSGRVKVVPFTRHFTETEQDKDLKRKLARPESLSGILNWCLDGLWLIRETGFTSPAAVLEATAKYRQDSDKIARFVNEMMEPDPHGEIRTEDAYKAYQDWCWRNGQQPEGMPNWKQAMESHADIRRKRPNGAGREINPGRYIIGLKLRA